MLRRIFLLVGLCITPLAAELSDAPSSYGVGALPLVFVKNKLTLPHTTVILTVNAQQEPTIHAKLRRSFDEQSQLVFIREGSPYADAWFGIMGNVEEYSLQGHEKGSSVYNYTVALDALVRIPSPHANLIQETNGEFYLRTVRLSTLPIGWQSPQAMQFILHKLIFPLLPREFRTAAFKQQLSKKDNLNEIVQTLVDTLNLAFTDAQITALLRHQESGNLEAFVQLIAKAIQSQSPTSDAVDIEQTIIEGGPTTATTEQLETVSPGSEEEVAFFRKRAEALVLPAAAARELQNAIDQYELDRTSPISGATLRKYIKTFIELPWGTVTNDNLDLNSAETTLHESHYGLSEVKDKILDWLALKACNPDAKSNIICLVGPPGVGKTSICRTIAKALNRKYARVALGGVHTENAIRGTSRTYAGAQQGKILQALHRAGSMNPVIVLDEIDKIASGPNLHNGDPSAALLEVLDPEQNTSFEDDYLNVPIDLSKVLFITTANDASAIPWPLLDRMELINLSGYSTNEKTEIAKRHILPELISDAGLADSAPAFPDEVLHAIIDRYTTEAGVRTLKSRLKTLIAKYARAHLKKVHITFTVDNLRDYLHVGRTTMMVSGKPGIGVANGMYYSPIGGGVLYIETNLPPRELLFEREIKLTGRLKKVMRESAHIALTYTQVNAAQWGIDAKRFTDYNIHIHVPEGGVPKDGPSAGIALMASLVSALSNRPVNGSFAMTGEINLRGEVTAIGGVKEKLLGAHRAGVRNVIVPEQNRPHVEEIDHLPEDLKVYYVRTIDEALKLVLLPA